jgi:hypothetical protein
LKQGALPPDEGGIRGSAKAGKRGHTPEFGAYRRQSEGLALYGVKSQAERY